MQPDTGTKGQPCALRVRSRKDHRLTTEQRGTVLFVVAVAALVFLFSPAWPLERDPWPYIVLLAGILGVPVFAARDRNGHDDDGGPDE